MGRLLSSVWRSEHYVGGLRDRSVHLEHFNRQLQPMRLIQIEQMRRLIIQGDVAVFRGPIYDQEGQLRIARGETLRGTTAGDSYYVMGVEEAEHGGMLQP